MENWKRNAQRLAAQAERRLDAMLRGQSGDAMLTIHPFRGYGTAELLHVTGRLLRQPRIDPATDLGSPWTNVVETFRRLASAEVPGVAVAAEYRGRVAATQSDEEGYFHLAIDVSGLALGESLRHEVALQAAGGRARAVAEVIVPPASARFGVISDIDDTIVETHATSLLRMARTVFTQNARGRVPMEGVPAFYRQLEAGRSGADCNPLFFVSSSPWNFYDLLDQFLAVNGIPSGPLMLQDYGFDETKLLHDRHDDHKLRQIGEIFATYPALPFVLLGDSGQRDPEIYRQVALGQPSRVAAIYIRDVTSAARDLEVRRIADELTAAGTKIALIERTAEAMLHARALGLIR